MSIAVILAFARSWWKAGLGAAIAVAPAYLVGHHVGYSAGRTATLNQAAAAVAAANERIATLVRSSDAAAASSQLESAARRDAEARDLEEIRRETEPAPVVPRDRRRADCVRAQAIARNEGVAIPTCGAAG